MSKAKKKTTRKKKDLCFVLTPYGGWFDEYYENIYKPAIEGAGLKPFRADDLYRPSQIIQDIWEHTKKAKILLADLTDKNPNVFYELGLAHALAKPVILVTESIEDVPFDLRGLRVIEYDKNSHIWGDKLKKDITRAIKEILESPEKSIPSTFLEAKREKNNIVTPAEKEIVDIKQEMELLKREMRTRRRHAIVPEPMLSPNEAEELIRSYMGRGMPAVLITQRLKRRGPPVSWIKKTITEIKKE